MKVLHNGGIWTYWERSFDSQEISERNVHYKEWVEDSGNLQRKPSIPGHCHFQYQGGIY